MIKHIDKDPTYWRVSYDLMGWSITSVGCQFEFPLSETQARYAISAIDRAYKVYNHFTAEKPWGLALI